MGEPFLTGDLAWPHLARLRTDPDATKLDEVSYLEVLNRGLKAMDSTAITLCMENKLPVVVFNLFEEGNMERVVKGEPLGTTIRSGT